MIDNLNEVQFLIYEDDSRVEVIMQDETLWATDILKEYIQKGFKIDVERMKQGESIFGKDYFRELLETVRSIRASERRIWQ
jgi:Virulence protein